MLYARYADTFNVMHGTAVLIGMAIAGGGTPDSRPQLTHTAAHHKATAVVEQLRFVVDDIPAAGTVSLCARAGRGWRCPYALTFPDGERFQSTMVLRRQRDGSVGWRLMDELPVRWPEEPVPVG